MDYSPSQYQSIPQDPNDAGSISAFEALDATSLAASIPRVLESTRNWPYQSTFLVKFGDLIRWRAIEPAIVSTISSILSRPSNSNDDLRTLFSALDYLSDLSEDQLIPYRPALVDLSNIDANGQSDRRFTGYLALQSKDMIKFMDDRTAVWTPSHKGDGMAKRTLRERVHTAEQMRPHIEGLLGWLQDGNWPPYSSCEEQLARFPELAVEEINATIAKPKTREDGEWILNMLCFVEKSVPIGVLWEKLYPQIQDIIENPTKDAEESGLIEYAPGWIATVDEWRNKTQKSNV